MFDDIIFTKSPHLGEENIQDAKKSYELIVKLSANVLTLKTMVIQLKEQLAMHNNNNTNIPWSGCCAFLIPKDFTEFDD